MKDIYQIFLELTSRKLYGTFELSQIAPGGGNYKPCWT